MGLRLALLDWWMPKQVIYRELDKVAVKTTDALKEVIKNNTLAEIGGQELHLAGSLEQRRAGMAKLHTDLVQLLVEAVGKEKAIALGREALFKYGKELGAESRRRLGVRNPSDLVKAASVLYRVLGIEFNVHWIDKTKGILTVHRCALAKDYGELTCQILSATDEGVINGLVPKATMRFKEKLTGGCSACTAEITLEESS